jgi:hypothetical protein
MYLLDYERVAKALNDEWSRHSWNNTSKNW